MLLTGSFACVLPPEVDMSPVYLGERPQRDYEVCLNSEYGTAKHMFTTTPLFHTGPEELEIKCYQAARECKTIDSSIRKKVQIHERP